jgi:hypothetical protein
MREGFRSLGKTGSSLSVGKATKMARKRVNIKVEVGKANDPLPAEREMKGVPPSLMSLNVAKLS